MANIFAVLKYLAAKGLSFTNDLTVTGTYTNNGDVVVSDAAGTGAGAVKSIQGQNISMSATLPTTTGAAGGTAGTTAANGAAGTGTTAGGAGGAASVTGGTGGAKATTGAAVGGAGGAASVTAGNGGNTASSGSDNAGAGGATSVTGGNGGNATAGTGNGGRGGDVSLAPGAGGTTTGGTVGSAGVVKASRPIIQNHPVTSTYTGTASITAKELATGWIGYTGAGHTLTLPTATNLSAELGSGGATQGTEFTFIVQATTGVATIAVNTGIVAQKQINTTDAAQDIILTVDAGAIGVFKIVFLTSTTARLCRIA